MGTNADATMRNTDRKNAEITLKKICLRGVRKHFAAVGVQAVLELPVPLIEELLPHLTVCQLDELQPALNLKGISTHSGWIGILEDMCGCVDHVIDLQTEEEAKHEVMRKLFKTVFYGFPNDFVNRNITNLNTLSFLCAAAKCIRHFLLTTSFHKPLQSLTCEQRPLLDLLEKHIRSVGVSQANQSKKKTHTALYILHRLLDHGVAKEVVVHVQCPLMLAWLLHGRGSQYVNCKLKKLMLSKSAAGVSQAPSTSTGLETRNLEDQNDQDPPCKRSKLDSVSAEEEEESGKSNLTVDPQVLCRTFTPCAGPPAAVCPWGRIERLEIRRCGYDSLMVLNSALPTFFCLRSLTLYSISTFSSVGALDLAAALKRLSDSCRSCLANLSVSVLPSADLLGLLLDAGRSLTSLHVEVQPLGPTWPHPWTADGSGELPLEKLTVKVAQDQTDLNVVTSVLRRCPCLHRLHVAGIRLSTGSSQSQLLTTLSESNRCLRSLTLEDLNLSDCLPEILHLVRNCKLEELQFIDCRLLEKSSDKQQSLQQLVEALKSVSSLQTLSLAQNRLAKNVCVLAELFSGSSPSSVKRLDISSNFIQPAELLHFSDALRSRRPPQRLTLDLRKNPGDRDPDTWSAALRQLRPLCILLVEGWKSRDMMADHISNM